MSFFTTALQSIDILIKAPGVGEKTIQSLRLNNITTLMDLLLYYPRDSKTVPLTTMNNAKEIAAIQGVIVKIQHTKHIKIRYIVDFKDNEGTQIKLLFSNHIPLSLKTGQKIIIYGKQANKTFVHPKILYSWQEEQFHYKAKMPLTDAKIKQCLKYALTILPQQSTKELSQYTHVHTWHDFFAHLHGLHGIQSFLKAQPALQYLEAIAWHLSSQHASTYAHSHYIYSEIASKYMPIYEELSKDLTSCQQQAFQDICQDLLASDSRHRMIFGDVCTGKTRVSILTALLVLSKGHQIWLLAPTTMLAKQHFDTFQKIFGDLAKVILHYKKEDIFSADILIGTHSLLYAKATNRIIGLLIIDEQHKFGVLQRHSLIQKDQYQQSYILSLSATPIPRSLALVTQKYINVSIMKTRTRSISLKTICLPQSQTDALIDKLASQDGLTYWICPVIDENELELVSVHQRFEALKQRYSARNALHTHDYAHNNINADLMNAQSHNNINEDNNNKSIKHIAGISSETQTTDYTQSNSTKHIACIHGGMKTQEQEQIYAEALAGNISILVSTTVIEVGIDISHANLIIIEHAERFGLSQLHQLRGRVGRFGKDGLCVLIYRKNISSNAQTRLDAMKRISNGFELAEIDLQIRGPGAFLGTEQTGFNEFSFLDPVRDCNVLSNTYTFSSTLSYGEYADFIQCFFSPASLAS